MSDTPAADPMPASPVDPKVDPKTDTKDGQQNPDPVDDLVTTQHSLQTASGTLNYSATAGRIVVREEVLTEGAFDGHQAKIEMFVVAYTLDGADPTTRPITFAFNGGPGSSSVWLHLGLLG